MQFGYLDYIFLGFRVFRKQEFFFFIDKLIILNIFYFYLLFFWAEQIIEKIQEKVFVLNGKIENFHSKFLKTFSDYLVEKS